MRARIVVLLCVGAPLGACGSGPGDGPPGPPSDAEYGRALQGACAPVAQALEREELDVLSVPDNTLVDDSRAFDRQVTRAVGILMDAVDASYPTVAGLRAPPERAAFARALRADRDAVRAYTAAIRRAAADNDSASADPVREPRPPRALRQPLPRALARAAPACRRLFPLTG